MAAFGINGGGVVGLLRSHPPLEQRIQALQAMGYSAPINASV